MSESRPLSRLECFLFLAVIGLVVVGLVLCEEARAEGVPEVVLQTIAMESAGESDLGMGLVAKVIVNRARLSGKTLEEVCLAPKQFSAWNKPEWARKWLRSHFSESTHQRAKKALEWALSLDSAMFNRLSHYHNTAILPYWARGKAITVTEGNHAFYEGIA